MLTRAVFSLFALATFGAGTANNDLFAQSQLFDVAPLQVVGQIRRATTDDFNQAMVGIQRAVPVAYLLPQVTPDSYFDVLRATLGARFRDGDDTAFRFRATGLKFEIQKSPWAATFTIVDYNASGLDDVNTDWLGISIGPGFDFGSEHNRVVIRVLLGGAVNSHRFGTDVFQGLGEEAGDSRHGFSYGVGFHGGIVLGTRIRVSGKYDLGRHASSTEFSRDTIEAGLSFRATDRLMFVASYSSLDASLDGLSEQRRAYGFGIRYMSGESLY